MAASSYGNDILDLSKVRRQWPSCHDSEGKESCTSLSVRFCVVATRTYQYAKLIRYILSDIIEARPRPT